MAINQHVISDILVEEADMTFEEFVAQIVGAGPVSYDAWHTFVSGDYEYDKAVYRGAIISNGESLPSFSQLDLVVDVPDVFDRGSVTTSAAGVVAVVFNRPFYAAPEINASIKSGSIVGVPRITSITNTGFNIDLVDPTNARIVGVCSWAARGY